MSNNAVSAFVAFCIASAVVGIAWAVVWGIVSFQTLPVEKQCANSDRASCVLFYANKGARL